MYEQIKFILQQNNIPFKDFLWTDEFGKLQLNDNEDWIEYVEDNIDQGIVFVFPSKRAYYTYKQQLNLGFTTVILVDKEEPKEENSNE